MSAYYAFEFSSATSKEIVEDKVANIVGSGYSVWLDEGKVIGCGKWDRLDWFCNIGYCGGEIEENEKQAIRKVVDYLKSIALNKLIRYWPSVERDIEGINLSPEKISVEDIFNKYPPSMGYNISCYLLKI